MYMRMAALLLQLFDCRFYEVNSPIILILIRESGSHVAIGILEH